MIEYKSPFNGPKENRSENEIASITLDCCFTIHRELGPSLLESVYETCLIYELEQKGMPARKVLNGYMEAINKSNAKIPRDWSK
jgi:hypothetical protein